MSSVVSILIADEGFAGAARGDFIRMVVANRLSRLYPFFQWQFILSDNPVGQLWVSWPHPQEVPLFAASCGRRSEISRGVVRCFKARGLIRFLCLLRRLLFGTPGHYLLVSRIASYENFNEAIRRTLRVDIINYSPRQNCPAIRTFTITRHRHIIRDWILVWLLKANLPDEKLNRTFILWIFNQTSLIIRRTRERMKIYLT
jgi:hypothetical protein